MANVTWVGVSSPVVDNEWSFAGGWSTNAVPDFGDTITVQTGSPPLLLSSTNPGGPTTTANITIAAATVARGARWNIQAYPHQLNISTDLEVDGGMSVISDPFDLASFTLDIGGTLIVTNLGGGLSVGGNFQVGGYSQGADSGGSPTSVFVQAAAVTNNSGTNNGTITIQSEAAVGSTATLDVLSAAGVSGQDGVLVGSFNIGTDGLHSGGAGLLEFASGQITTIQGPNATFGGASLSIYGSHSFIADAGSTTSNSALTGLAAVNGPLTLQAGVTIATTGAVTIGIFGTVAIDTDFFGTAGSTFQVGGVSGAQLTVNGALYVGRQGMTGNSTVTASSITNAGTISLDGADAADEGQLLIGSTAGFGTAGTLTGNVNLQDFSLLQFASGSISTIAQGASLQINSSHAFLADVSSVTTNSALTGLTTVNGSITLQNGVQIAPTSPVTVGSNGSISLDTGFLGTAGSVFAVTGTLTDNGYISVGRGAMTGNAQITAGALAGNGSISIDGADAADQGQVIVNSAAGFGGAGVVTGSILLQDYSLLQFASGQINTVNFGGSIRIVGSNSFLADSGSTSSNSALHDLSQISGSFSLEDGATLTTSGGMTVGNGTDGALVAVFGGTLTLTGTLNINKASVQIGTPFDTTAASATTSAVVLSNGSSLFMFGGAGGGATLNVGSSAGFGTAGVIANGNVDLEDNSLLQFTSGQIDTIAFGGHLTIMGPNAFLADVGSTTSNSALTTLATVGGDLTLLNGASISDSGSLTIGDGTHGASADVENGASLGVLTTLTVDSHSVLTIGGIGDSAVSNVSAAALANANAIFINSNSANNGVNRGKLTVNGAATSTGTISLNGGTMHVTGALSSAGGTVNLANGALLELGSSASGGTIAFGAGASTVLVDTTTVPTDVIKGFAHGDIIDLAAHSFNSSDKVTLLGGNILDIAPAGGGAHIDLQLDPTQDFHGGNFRAVSDGGTGTDLIEDQSVVVAVSTASGVDLRWATLYDELANSPIVTGGSVTQFTAVDTGHFNGHTAAIRFVVTGTFFGYSGSSPAIQLVSGTITSIQVQDSSSNILATFSGLSISATVFQTALNTYTGNSTDPSALNAIFLGLSYSAAGGAGADKFQGGNINDTTYATAGDDAITGGAGVNTVDYSGVSTSGIVAIVQGAGGTVNKGGANGSDTLTNIQNLVGSTGGDVFYIDAPETVAGGGGFDYLIELSAGVTLRYGSNFNAISQFVSNVGTNIIDFGADANVAYVYGSTGNDTLTLGSGGGYMFGEGGTNVLNGGANATNLFVGGGGGIDTMNGGSGTANNFYYVDGNDQVNGAGAFNAVVELVSGVTLQIGSAQYQHVQEFVGNTGANVVTVANTDADFVYLYGGAGNDTLTTGSGGGYLIGEGGTNVLSGGGGINVFVADGASGLDTMNGGSGSNIYLIDANSVVHGSGTFNTVEELQQNVLLALGSAQLGSNIQQVVLAGGNNSVDFHSATSSVFLYGAGGNDTLFGGTGNDFLYGAGGINTFTFGTGWGKDTIMDWTSGSNQIDLGALAGLGVHAITDLTQTIVGGSDVITSSHTGTNSITLNGFGGTLAGSSFQFT